MPSVELTPLASWLVMAMTTSRGQCLLGAKLCACQSGGTRATKPPHTERAALAEPRRAHSERRAWFMPSWQWASMAVTRAAKPAALEARPALVGKLLLLSMRMGGRLNSCVMLSTKVLTFKSSTTWPFNWNSNWSLSLTRVFAHSSDKVIDRFGVAGILPALSCLPQYLTRAMLGCANA